MPPADGPMKVPIGSDYRTTILDVHMIWIAPLVDFSRSGISQNQAPNSRSKQEHDEEDIHVRVVVLVAWVGACSPSVV